MSVQAQLWTMIAAGSLALIAGLALVQPRFRAATNASGRFLTLAPVFEAVALAVFGAEHFVLATDLKAIVPAWLPFPYFWAYFFGFALLAAAVSFIVWKHVPLAASLLALFFLLVVVTVDLPNLHTQFHDRFFWILTLRETAFASGALVLAGSLWRKHALARAGQLVLAPICVFYGIQHFLHPRNVPGVPLENMIPAWFPAPEALSGFIGTIVFVAGIGLLLPRTAGKTAALAGAVLTLLVLFFYVPILVTEIHTPLSIEGLNYVGDTLLFAATIMLAGYKATEA